MTSTLTGIDHAKLEAQASAFAAEINAEGWTVMIDYSATGEGRHVWYMRVHGGTEEEAIKDFRRGFFTDDDERRGLSGVRASVFTVAHSGRITSKVTGRRQINSKCTGRADFKNL